MKIRAMVLDKRTTTGYGTREFKNYTDAYNYLTNHTVINFTIYNNEYGFVYSQHEFIKLCRKRGIA